MLRNTISLLWGEEKVCEKQWYSFLYKHNLMYIPSLINNKLVTNTVKINCDFVQSDLIISK